MMAVLTSSTEQEIIADTVESASILAGKLGSVPEKEEAKKQTIAYGNI